MPALAPEEVLGKMDELKCTTLVVVYDEFFDVVRSEPLKTGYDDSLLPSQTRICYGSSGQELGRRGCCKGCGDCWFTTKRGEVDTPCRIEKMRQVAEALWAEANSMEDASPGKAIAEENAIRMTRGYQAALNTRNQWLAEHARLSTASA